MKIVTHPFISRLASYEKRDDFAIQIVNFPRTDRDVRPVVFINFNGYDLIGFVQFIFYIQTYIEYASFIYFFHVLQVSKRQLC